MMPDSMMRSLPVSLVLAPVLIWQGRRVKQRTPRLPEAEGPRSGSLAGGPRRVRLLILGDSAAAGTGVHRQEHCLSHQIPGALSSRYTVDWRLEAESGVTTRGMVARLARMAAAEFDLAVVSLGVNDVKANVPVPQWMDRQRELVSLLRARFGVRQVILTAVPPMEKFPALPWPLNRYLGARAGAMNQALSRWTETEGRATFLKLDLPLEPGLMAKDGFHPGPALHRIWAEQAAAVVQRDLGRPLVS